MERGFTYLYIAIKAEKCRILPPNSKKFIRRGVSNTPNKPKSGEILRKFQHFFSIF